MLEICAKSAQRETKPRHRSRSPNPKNNWHLCSKAQDLAFMIMKARSEWKKKYWKKPANSNVLLLLSCNSCSTRLPPPSRVPGGHAAPKPEEDEVPGGTPGPPPRPRSPGRAADGARHCGAPWRRSAAPAEAGRLREHFPARDASKAAVAQQSALSTAAGTPRSGRHRQSDYFAFVCL